MKTNEKVSIRVLAIIALVVVVMFVVTGISRTHAAAEEGALDDAALDTAEATPTGIVDYVNAEEYLTCYYHGEINELVSTSVNVRYGPGSSDYEVIKSAAGNQVKLKRGTKVIVMGETKDSALDAWYHIKVEFDGETIEGYCSADYITRLAETITFTPTPMPEPSATAEPTPTIEAASTPDDTEPPVNDSTKEMLEENESNPLKPLKYVFIIAAVVLVFCIVYTQYTKIQEKKLEKEMERYTQRGGFEKLEGEKDEDFKDAKKEYYDYLKLGDQTNRNLAEELGDPEDIHLDLTGLFDEDTVAAPVLPKEPEAEETKEDTIELNEIEEELGETLSAWSKEDAAYVGNLTKELPEEEKALYTKLEQTNAEVAPKEEEEIVVPEPSQQEIIFEKPTELPTAEAAVTKQESPEMLRVRATRAKLDALKEQEMIQHRLYGEGEVIDNSDAEIIQVRFGRDLYYLKKQKQAEKDLVMFRE